MLHQLLHSPGPSASPVETENTSEKIYKDPDTPEGGIQMEYS